MDVKMKLSFLMVLPLAMGDQIEKNLYKRLLSDYEPLERPVVNSSYPVTIYLGITLQQLIDLDEKNQILILNAWLKYTWEDYNLKWEPTEHDGVADLRFPADLIWRPDVLLYNSVDSNFDSTYRTNVVVYSSGTINWIPPGIFKLACKIDITYFPFDEQVCFLKFGSWTYDGTKLDLQPDPDAGFDLSEYLENGEWFLAKTEVNRSVRYYDCCPEPYPDLKFYITMRRRTLYYGFNMILPSILITFMTNLGFLLPPDAGEKITLQITVMLSICFFLNIVADMSPPTSEAVPLLGVFFSSCMVIVSGSVVMTVAVLSLHYRTPATHTMPWFCRAALLHWLPWLLCIHRPTADDLPKAAKVADALRRMPPLCEHRLDEQSESLLRNVRPTHDAEQWHRHNSLDLEQRVGRCASQLAGVDSPLALGQQAQILMLQRIYAQIKFISGRMVIEDDNEKAVNEWQFAAMVVDRLCLVILTVFIFSSVLYIYLAAPYLIA